MIKFFSKENRELRARERERKALLCELENVWTMRLHLAKREKAITQKLKRIGTVEMMQSIPTRSVRGW